MSERFFVHLDDLFTAESHVQQLLSDVQGKCIIANGCFDVLHSGHLHLLRHLHAIARIRCLHPIVAMNSDRSVRALKGSSRPIVPQRSRADLLTTLQWPFSVVIFDEDSPQRLMDVLQPIVVLKGDEYPKESVVRWKDSEVVTVGMFLGWSTSIIIGDR